MSVLTNSSVYSDYVYPESKTNWTSTKKMKETLTKVEIDKSKRLKSGGIPVISDGKIAYIDDSDNHCCIFGTSGFKKSICGYMPIIDCIALAGESMVILDPKGELYSRTAKHINDCGYNTIVLNFRDFNADGYNPLHYPARLWKAGDIDKAASITNDFNSTIARRQDEHGTIDPFWPETAKAYINGVLPLMFDSYNNIDNINMLTLADYFTERSSESLKSYVFKSEINNTAMSNLRTVLSEPEKTRLSTLATCSSFIQPFIQNDKLARMLSHSTFELEDIATPKTALYIITDDTTTVCNPIVGVLINQLQTVLVNKAFHSENSKLENRVNFILDEFCSFPVPGISEALATHRSRNIRYFLCIQSLSALRARYPHYESLLTNCATSVFFGSTEEQLLKMISDRCGKTEKTVSGNNEPLISVPELMTLKKNWDSKEVLYMNLAESIRYCTALPAIEQYDAFCCEKSELPNVTHPPVNVYTFQDLLHDISIDEAKAPFSQLSKKHKTNQQLLKRGTSKLDLDMKKEIERKFDELFGTVSEEEG